MIKNSDRRNILLIHQHFCPPGGFGNNRSFEIAKSLTEAGHRVTILTGSGNFNIQPDTLFSTQSTNGIQIDCIRIKYDHHMSYVRRMYAFASFFILSCLRVFRYKKSTDVIYAVSTPLSIGVIGLWYQCILRKPMFFEIGDLWPDVPVQMGIVKNTLLIRFLYWMEQKIYAGSRHIILLSEGMRAYMLKKGIPAEKFSVLYNGTNIHQFSPVAGKEALRKQYNIPIEQFIVLYAGTMGVANRLEFFVDAAAHIEALGNTSICFYFIGGGNRLDAMKKYAAQKNLSSVLFLDSMSKDLVSDYFRLADIGIVSFAPFDILETNSANKYYDYLASGLPVLINYEGWQKIAIEDAHCGYSVTDVETAGAKIIQLSQQPEEYSTMSANARVLAEDQYDRNIIAMQLSLLISQQSSSEAYNRIV
ncbi:MAG: glycosyltransferase family 4 protein [Cytophagales bacterium]|nr:glycosyltransferase family 4 protein [Cytophaga sp.]